jgi:hypothetical protein
MEDFEMDKIIFKTKRPFFSLVSKKRKRKIIQPEVKRTSNAI